MENLTDGTWERIAAYIRLAREVISEKHRDPERALQLDADLANYLGVLHAERLLHGWRPYPECRPSQGERVWVELQSGESFQDVFCGKSWLVQKDSDVIAWRHRSQDKNC